MKARVGKHGCVCVCVHACMYIWTLLSLYHTYTSLPPIHQEELKAYHTDRRKEVNQQKTLDRTRVNDPANRRRIVSSTYMHNVKIMYESMMLLFLNPFPLDTGNE